MTLFDAIERYISARQLQGYRFERGTRTLLAFVRFNGNAEIREIKSGDVLCFLNRVPTTNITWRLKYWTIYRFLEYWVDHEELSVLEMPTPKPFVQQNFTPHIFTRFELRSLLATNKGMPKTRGRLGHHALGMLIVLLYATGAGIGECTSSRLSDLDIVNGTLMIDNTQPLRKRLIPIGPDLVNALRQYLEWRLTMHTDLKYLFVGKWGGKVSAELVSRNFAPLRQRSKVRRRDGSSRQPRLDDLRFTFAVHRIDQWLRAGADLNRMLPALAAYMGQMGLGSTDRYLFLTPERFRKDLDKLSNMHGNGGWKDKPELIQFLESL